MLSSAIIIGRVKAFAAAASYGFPARKLNVVGITGADGKTTVGMIAHVLNACGYKTGAFSTQDTSPSPLLIQKFLRRLVNEGCTHAVLEYPSDGLVQGHMGWTWPVVAGITNAPAKHDADYENRMDESMRAKALLLHAIAHPLHRFSLAMLFRRGTKVLPLDDPDYARFIGIPTKETIAYGRDIAPDEIEPRFGPRTDLWLEGIRMTDEGTKATLRWRDAGPKNHWPLTLNISGDSTLMNALCAIGCIKALPKDPPPMRDIVAALATFTGASEDIFAERHAS